MLSLISGCIVVGGDTEAQVVCKMHVLAHLHLTSVPRPRLRHGGGGSRAHKDTRHNQGSLGKLGLA